VFERSRVEVDGPPLGVARAGHQAGVLEHLDVLRHGLLGDREGFGELVDGGVAAGEPRDDSPADGIAEGQERAVELVVRLGLGDV